MSDMLWNLYAHVRIAHPQPQNVLHEYVYSIACGLKRGLLHITGILLGMYLQKGAHVFTGSLSRTWLPWTAQSHPGSSSVGNQPAAPETCPMLLLLAFRSISYSSKMADRISAHEESAELTNY